LITHSISHRVKKFSLLILDIDMQKELAVFILTYFSRNNHEN